MMTRSLIIPEAFCFAYNAVNECRVQPTFITQKLLKCLIVKFHQRSYMTYLVKAAHKDAIENYINH